MPSLPGVGRPTPAICPKPVVADHNFSGYSPSKITMYRDGGTIKLEGHLNRSFTGSVRFDGAMSSPTRGQFFSSVKHFAGKAEAERPMSRADLKELQGALQRYVKNTQGEDPAYKILLKNIDQALGTKPAPKLPTAAQLKNVLGTWEFHHAKWNQKKPSVLKDDNVLKQFTLSKPPAGSVGGSTVSAFVLKDAPDKVVFEKNVGGRRFYFGPVSHQVLPK